ncbi:hypothetical protein BCR36DRAFT_281237 [Piromyces finnis]|uniref:G domain-containing protein n=1 Tax=Piromyces finnis TaxID=1754191 RepID=A0A1Y1VH55_9FUNG|nr:hypothetical protein BCR36DRAFT_281237 [Piromyces finnis]|eukprot:ORX56039.1 hypothetical protein BCR36DRAFT_281237 [Piromyces finnis]
MDVDDIIVENLININENSESKKKNNDNNKQLKGSSSTSSFEENMPDIRKGNIEDVNIDFNNLIHKGDSFQSDTSSTLYGNSKFNKNRQDNVEVLNSQEKNKKMMETINVINNLVNDYIELINKKNKENDTKQPELINLENFHNSTNYLISLLNEDRYPLIALIGRRGSGKSSFVNAIIGKKVAELGNICSQTGKANFLSYRGNNNSGIDILDTRGINEGQKPQEEDQYETPVESIVAALTKYPVDCILYLHKAKELDSGIESDIQQLNEIIVKANIQNLKIPIIGIVTHCDELEPSDLKKAIDYDEEKLENILKAQALLKQQLLKYAPDIKDCLVGVEVVSSAIIWKKEPDENGDILPKRDYRYNIDKIIDLLINNIKLKAMFKIAQICNIQEVKVKLANELSELISSFVTVISSVPNPYSQNLPLNDLRVWMIYTIARLNNSTVTYETVYEFLNMFGFLRLSGYAIYNVVGAITKVIPGFGNKVNLRSKKALSLALGKAAIAYFLENKSQDNAIEIFNATRNELEKTITEESLQAHQDMINSLNHME